MEKRPAVRVVAFILASSAFCGCGGGNSQASPTSPAANSDLTGTWTQVGGTRTWTLTQVGFQVAGPASFSQVNNPSFGAVSATGFVVGGAAFGGLTFAESYERLSGPTVKPNSDCYIDVQGQLAISGDSMTGSYTEVDACAGVHLSQLSGKLTLQRN